MSRHEYLAGQNLESMDMPFYALIQAAMRKADSTNIWRLRRCWPEVYNELEERYNTPGGYLENELQELETENDTAK